MVVELLSNQGGHQVGHGMGSNAMALGGTLKGGGDPKNP